MLKPASNKINNKLTNLPRRFRVYIVSIQKSNMPALLVPVHIPMLGKATQIFQVFVLFPLC